MMKSENLNLTSIEEQSNELSFDNRETFRIPISLCKYYSRSSCKHCFGRGYHTFVQIDGKFDRMDLCKCVKNNKKFPELVRKIRETMEEMNKNNDLSKKIKERSESAMEEQSSEIQNQESKSEENIK